MARNDDGTERRPNRRAVRSERAGRKAALASFGRSHVWESLAQFEVGKAAPDILDTTIDLVNDGAGGPADDWVRKRAAEMLDSFVTTQRVPVTVGGFAGPSEIEIVRSATGEATISRARGPRVVTVFLGLAFALTSERGARLRRCPDPKCARYFLRTGKMTYCSARCSRRVNARKARAKEREIIRAHRARASRRHR